MTKEELLTIVNASETINEVLTKLGKNNSSVSYKIFHKLVEKYEIDISHFLNKREHIIKMQNNKLLKKCEYSDIFCENSMVARKTVKNRIIKDKLIEYKCCFCENEGYWLGNKISLILDHINGVNNDNRIENLRFVCPNCNSALETHCVGSKTLNNKQMAL